MKRGETRQWRGRESAVAAFLMTNWDPIGVSDVPEAQDEYDSYVPEFVALLTRDASDGEIAHALYRIETVTMGLHGASIVALQEIARRMRTACAL